jgi:pimeloyl-ACP methyl ester carboxylesterase
MRVASTNDVDLEVHDLGGEGPPVLLVHATGFHGRVWEPLAADLDGYHRWSVDIRAHGDSTEPVGRPMEWEGFADDVLAVVDGLGLDRPFGVGHSKGGAALLLAEQARPGTFRALYVYEPVVMPPDLAIGPQSENPLSRGARRRRDTFASLDEAYTNYSSKPPFDGLDPAVLRAYVDHGFASNPDGTVSLKCRPEMEAAVYEHGSAHQAFASLGAVRCPVTVAIGAEDGFPAAFGRPIAAALPDGHVAAFPDLGHFGPLEDPARVAASVLDAFADVD